MHSKKASYFTPPSVEKNTWFFTKIIYIIYIYVHTHTYIYVYIFLFFFLMILFKAGEFLLYLSDKSINQQCMFCMWNLISVDSVWCYNKHTFFDYPLQAYAVHYLCDVQTSFLYWGASWGLDKNHFCSAGLPDFPIAHNAESVFIQREKIL